MGAIQSPMECDISSNSHSGGKTMHAIFKFRAAALPLAAFLPT